MLAGHVGAALGFGRAERRLNLGVLLAAALLPDMLLWTLVLLGVERAVAPPDFSSRHYLLFGFPYSHGLVSNLVWAALAGGITWLLTSRWSHGRARAALVVGLALFSHWILDLVVHVPELPLLGEDSPKVGLSLWAHTPLALAVESLITITGLVLFLRYRSAGRARNILLTVFVLALLSLTFAGQTAREAPPSIRAAAAISLIFNLVIVAVGAVLGPGRREVAPGRTQA